LGKSWLKDTVPQPKSQSFDSLSQPIDQPVEEKIFQQQILKNMPGSAPQLVLPAGTIAFSFFDAAPGRQVYETHLISPNGSHHRTFLLEGVSEPALSPGGRQMAYRAWSQPTSPRSLLSSNLEGYTPQRVGGFWEDALPDWSPIESRIIFSSQREADRRWRLYTSWGDGSNEVNLRREGRNPTFAPDGYRFAFESCDGTGSRCGLWLGDLENSEYDSYSFLEDSLAQAPDWSPVGETIVYMANPNDNWDLYLVESDGSRIRRLTTNPAIDGLPVWSPDGEWLAFLSDRGGAWGIWLLHVDTGKVEQVISLPGATFTPPADSPYGQRNWWDEQLSWSE
jgi:Tol biopolymer transport system component